MPETVYDRAKRTGYVYGPYHRMMTKNPFEKDGSLKPPKKRGDSGKVVIKAGQSLEEKRSMVEKAIAKKVYPPDKPKPKRANLTPRFDIPETSIWLKELTEDIAVFQCPKDGSLKAVDYSISDGEVALGEPFGVEIQYAKV